MQISFDWLFTNNLQKFLCKTYAIRFLMSQDYQKVKIYQNLTTESGSKQRFSLLQEKVVIQAVYLRTQTVSLKAQFYVLKEGYEYLAMEHLIEKNALYNY